MTVDAVGHIPVIVNSNSNTVANISVKGDDAKSSSLAKEQNKTAKVPAVAKPVVSRPLAPNSNPADTVVVINDQPGWSNTAGQSLNGSLVK